ncbi:MAG: tRNA (guanosine(18)-2'-O)-methyltransferase TrmH [Candidatus Marinimicrobia bacterium]|nr:tRNA (guanosine(18)-2'-O)-methyltransferase TrmH [Candidatus Neomarinimicrobiota bacterium]|tara:strand:- start:1063 stop:1710 length:648 start_codon:yes stop_codon:yes gene_type:complete
MTPERFQKIKDVLNKRQPDLTIIMDNVHKPHNLAAIIRSCDAVGIGNIHGISSNERKVGINLKAAGGSNKWVHLHIYNSKADVIPNLRSTGFRIYAANKSTKAKDYRSFDYTLPTAILVGSELNGISPKTLEKLDGEIMIPMEGMVANLNVSVATAVILFEVQKQRKKAGLYKKNRLDKKTYNQLLFEFSYPNVAKYYHNSGKSYPSLDKNGNIL